VDEELVSLISTAMPAKRPARKLQIEETLGKLMARGEEFSVTISKETGLIEEGMYAGEKIINGGPYIRLVAPGQALSWDVDSLLDVNGTEWKLDSMSYQLSGGALTVESRGYVGKCAAKLHMTLSGNGEIITSYEVEKPPEQCQEMGLRFVVNSSMDRLYWNRKGLWSTYPEDHIGRTVGYVNKLAPHADRERYRQKPEWPWSMDTKDFYLFPKEDRAEAARLPIPHDFRTLKENIIEYTLSNQIKGVGLRVESDGSIAARSRVKSGGAIDLLVDNEWTYLNLNWGNYERPVRLLSPYKGTVKVMLCRTE
jgi:hypothetical protein